jgi:hypothetical protein
MDASPFRERDLDPKAGEFIVDWSKSFSKNAKLSLLLYVEKGLDLQEASAIAGDAIRTYFGHRAEELRRRLRQLLVRGRTNLLIGFAALVALFMASNFVGAVLRGNPLGRMLQESLLIGGWVAMWRPMEIFLYDGWPIQSEVKLFERLSAMPVRVELAGNAPQPSESYPFARVALRLGSRYSRQ